jgi:hypothetical protein
MLIRRVVLVFPLLLSMSGAPLAYGQDLLSRFHPYVSVKEEYSDNLDLTSTNKKEDYFTTIQPGIAFNNMDNVSGVDLDYSLGAVFYRKNSNLNYISHNASLNAKYLTAGHVNFYLKESFIQSDDPREQEYFTATEDNRYVLATQTERAVYWRNVVSPTIEYQFGPENRVGINYRNNIYRTESASSQDSQEDYINPFFSYWFDKRNGVSIDYGLTLGKFEKNSDLTGHRASGRYTNRVSAKSSIFVEYAYSKRTFASPSDLDYDIHEPYVGMTFTITPTLTASAQVGYFWANPKTGNGKDGFSYKGELANIDPRTTYKLYLQGGYTEDFFTSENLGFSLYHRATGSLNHKLGQRVSIGCFGSLEWAEFINPAHTDTTWGIGGTASYMPLKWLTLSLEVSHRDRQSDVDSYEYAENRGMLKITATY